MISFVRGKLVSATAETITIEVGGIGFTITVAPSTLASLPGVGEEVVVHTHLFLRESGVELYGFRDEAERAAFFRLLSVGGIGPRNALALVGSLGVDGLWDAIRREDIGQLTKVPGVGKKLASRLVVELKDAVIKEAVVIPDGQGRNEALDALVTLGYTREEALLALSKVSEAVDTGERIKAALRWLDKVRAGYGTAGGMK